MATLAGSVPRAEDRLFHVRMACAFVCVAFGGFSLTYWSRLASPGFHLPPIVHIHALIFSAWLFFYLAQTALVATGCTPDHRSWGLAGISLFSVMLCTIVAVEVTAMRVAATQGFAEAEQRFSAVTLIGVVVLAALFAAAIVTVRRREVHRRLMLVVMVQLMEPAVARVFLTLARAGGAGGAGPPPPAVLIAPALVANLLLVVAIVHDRRRRGSAHPAYTLGGGGALAVMLSAPFVAQTDAWLAIARAVAALGG